MATRSWSKSDRLMGIWSATAIVLISLAYILTGTLWVISNSGAARVQGLEPTQPYLPILETLILLLTPAIVVLFAAIHVYAPADRKTCSLAAFGFALLLSGITGVNHFVQVTSIQRTSSRTIVEAFSLYDPQGRLAPVLAMDLAAWDFFFGFALLFAATIFSGDRLQNAIRTGLFLAGALCLAGVAGPGSGHLKFQYPAIAG